MKNKLLSIPKPWRIFTVTVAVILALVLLLSIIGPHIVLAAARRPEPAESYAYSDSFLTGYDEVRSHLGNLVSELREGGVTVEHNEYAVDESDDLYIDNIYLPPRARKRTLSCLPRVCTA